MQKELLKKLAECHKLAIKRALMRECLSFNIESFVGLVSLRWTGKGIDAHSKFYSLKLVHYDFLKGSEIDAFYTEQIEIADHWLKLLKEM